MNSPNISNNAFEQFRAFAKQIVSVPKAVIDKREKGYQKQRETLRKAKA